MKKFILSAALAIGVCVSFAFSGGDTHLKGVIEDSTCAASKSQMGMGADRIACVKKCIKGGAKAVLVVGDKIYQISNQKAVMAYAGKDVEVDAVVTNDSIKVDKIADAK